MDHPGGTVDMESLFQASPANYVVVDTDFVICLATDQFLQTTMTVREQIVGRPVLEVFADNPDDPSAQGSSAWRASLEQVLITGEPHEMEMLQYDIRRPDSQGGGFERRYWRPKNAPVFDGNGRLTHILHSTEDVTDLIELQRSGQALETASKAEAAARNQFLSRMSHELRTPLTAVIGFSQLIDHASDLAEVKEYSPIVVDASHHLLSLIDDVLEVSRIEGGRLALSLEPVNVAGLAREVTTLLRPLAIEYGVHVREAVTAETFAMADRRHLRQVLINLISNAIKYNRRGGQVTIAVDCDQNGHTAIKVFDTGHGIDTSDIERLFVPFERLSNPAHESVKGTGLGLVLCRYFTEAMGGTIAVESTVGKGSTFIIELDSADSPSSPGVEASGVDLVGEPAEDRRRRVLYVEDTVENVMLVRAILRQRPDIELLVSERGEPGVNLARVNRPALILLDLHLPDINGDEVLGRLKADPATAEIPVVILTADATEGRAEELLAAGATKFVTKPVSVAKLLEIVDELMDEAAI